jgi:hypothetical protein
MHTARLFCLLFIGTFVISGYGPDASQAPNTRGGPFVGSPADPATPRRDVRTYDLIQRTCALYVASRSSAWQGLVAFGREPDDSMIHWNKCPGGTMVACADVPTANGDTIRTGIPFPY